MFINKEIVISFGKKPNIGGSPPSEINRILTIIKLIEKFIVGEFSWFVIITLLELNTKKIGIIIIVYIVKYMKHEDGKKFAINAVIHPRCVIDE